MTSLFPANLMGPQGLLVLFVLLLLFGAQRLPDLARGLGEAIREFSKAKNDITDEIMKEPAPAPKPPLRIEAQTVQAEPAPNPLAPNPDAAPTRAPESGTTV